MNERDFPVTEWDTSNLRLRLLNEADVDAIAATCNDPQSQFYLPQLPTPYTGDDAREYLYGPAADAWLQNRAQWAIADRHSGDYLGSVGIPRIEWNFQTAEIGYLVAPWARGRGVAAEASQAVADFLFEHGIARAELHILPSNIASLRSGLRAGFSWDANLRSAIGTRGGERHDRIILSRLPSDPPGPSRRTLPDLPGGELTDGVITVRTLRPGDVDPSFAHSQHGDDWRSNVPPKPPTATEIAELCEWRAANQWVLGTSARMVIADRATGEYAGSISLRPTRPILGEGMLGYGLDPAYRGRGFMTRAVRLVSHWAIETAGMKRLVAGTAVSNTASQAVLDRAGFTREGVERGLLPGPDGGRIDNVLWSLLDEDR